TLGALLLAIYTSPSLVSLLLLGFVGVSQLFPGVGLGLFSKRVRTAGVFTGIVTGIVTGVSLVLTGRDPFFGFNAAFLALILNFTVTGAASLLTTVKVSGCEPPVQSFAAPAAVSGDAR